MKKIQILVNFTVRAILGMGLIFFVNYYFEQQQMGMTGGFNAISFLVSGLLGLPGVAMLYGIVIFPIL